MNTNRNPLVETSSPACRFAPLLGVIFAFSSPALFAQVKIPAKSASSLEQNPASSSATISTSPSSSFNGSSNVSRVPSPSTPITGDGATVSSVTAPVSDAKIDAGKIAANQSVPDIPPTHNLATVKRLSELRRELSISESSTTARIALPADDLFEENDPVAIDKFAVPALKKVAEFLQLSNKKTVTLTSLYAPDQESGKELAWGRSLALIEWLESQEQLEGRVITSSRPAPVKKPTPKKFTSTAGDVEFVNRIELKLEQ